MIRAWQLWVRFSQAHGAHTQRAQQRTKVKRDELLQQAQEAAAKGNAHTMWQVVKRLAPRAKFKKVQWAHHGPCRGPCMERDMSHNSHILLRHCVDNMSHWSCRSNRYDTNYVVSRFGKLCPRMPFHQLWRAGADQVVEPLVTKVNQDWSGLTS